MTEFEEEQRKIELENLLRVKEQLEGEMNITDPLFYVRYCCRFLRDEDDEILCLRRYISFLIQV